MMMIMKRFAQFCDRSGCQSWLPWISIRAAHSNQVHSTMMSQRHLDNNCDRMMSMIIIRRFCSRKGPFSPFQQPPFTMMAMMTRMLGMVMMSLKKMAMIVICHLSLPMAIGIMMVCLRVLCLSAFVETPTHESQYQMVHF